MSRKAIDRRQFLTLPLALLLTPLARVYAATGAHKAPYGVDVSILYGALTFRVEGTLSETIDRPGGRYDVAIAGEGDGIANRIESTGILRQGRWAPLRTQSFFTVKGRESRSNITYDYARRGIDYHFKGETFFLRRLRIADDFLPIPEGLAVDDSISATLNYADQLWTPQADGNFVTHVVRRKRAENEGPDDVQKHYRAELVPFALKVAVEFIPLVLRVVADPESGKPTALFDMSGFSSWAREDRPARIVFGPDRRPELIESSLILGTSVTIRLRMTA